MDAIFNLRLFHLQIIKKNTTKNFHEFHIFPTQHYYCFISIYFLQFLHSKSLLNVWLLIVPDYRTNFES